MPYTKHQWKDNVITSPYGPIDAQRLNEMETGIAGAATMTDLGTFTITSMLNGSLPVYTPSAGELVQLAWNYGTVVLCDNNTDMLVGPQTPVDAFGPLYRLLLWGPASGLGTDGPPNARPQAQGFVSDGTPIIACLATLNSGYALLTAPLSWQANHTFASLALIKAPDNHLWSANTGGGTSGGTIPNFAGNEGGTVVDGSITWTDEGAVPTRGSIHLYALRVTAS